MVGTVVWTGKGNPMTDDMVVSSSLLEAAKREMEEAYAKADRLREIYYRMGGGSFEQRERFMAMQRWRAVYELLRTKPGKKAAMTDIINELQRMSLDLGKYPLRTIKNALSSPFTRDYFKIEKVGNDEVVEIAAPL